jgi:tetratricopeptide (TPR) repeat protein
VSEFIHPYSLQLTGYPKKIQPLYRDYLQAKSFVRDITASVKQVQYSISESTRETIGTLEQIHERGYELATAIGSQLSEGFETISWKLDDVSQGIDSLNAKFDWGFGQMIAGIGRVNDTLQELVAIAKTPTATWSFEQYEIARDAIRRGLYPEALEALLHAINGHGNHIGYKLEFRFHYVLGILYLGDAENTDPTILDLTKAESSFLTAARYAKTDYRKEAGVALTAAGWAAYCQGKLKEAEEYTRQAIAIYSQDGEAFYQLAKIQMHTNRASEAAPNLSRAIDTDPNYSIKSATDPDFLKHETDLKAVIEERRVAAQQSAKRAIENAGQALSRVRDWGTSNFPSEWNSLKESLQQTERSHNAGTLFGFLDAASSAKATVESADKLLKKLKAELALRGSR